MWPRPRAAPCRIFPALERRAITHAWGGPIDVSPSHIPQVGTLPGAPVHFAFGYTGNGVGPTHLAARALASLALDRRDRWTALPIVGADAGAWVPPEPLAWLGGNVVRQAFLRREEALEQGEQPRAVQTSPTARRCAAGRRRSNVYGGKLRGSFSVARAVIPASHLGHPHAVVAGPRQPSCARSGGREGPDDHLGLVVVLVDS